MRRAALLSVVLAALLPSVASAADPAATTLTQQVTREGQTVTMRLSKLPLRGPHFEVRVQQANGTYAMTPAPIGERSFIGTVDEHPGAIASGIVQSDGKFKGQIVFDRGATWFTLDGAVTDTRGLDAPVFKWPTLPNLAAGLAGSVTRAWDLAVDTDKQYLTDRGSVASALDAIEYTVSSIRAIYLQDALLVPRLARIVLRAGGTDPYASATGYTGLTRDHWKAAQTDAQRDEVLMFHALGGGGGVAYKTNFNPDFAYATGGDDDDGTMDVVGRHEIGHNFNIGDNHAGNPEGATIMEGNAYARFNGPELQSLFTSRNDRLSVFDTVGRYATTGVPPYAGLDLLDGVPVSGERTVDVLANDHDANGQALRLVSVDGTTSAGGSASIADGRVLYRAPAASTTLDTFSYVISDTCGQTATGVVFARTGSATRTDVPARTRATPLLDAGRLSCAELPPGGTTPVPIAGVASGTDVTGVRLRVRVTKAKREGRVTVWPCGTKRPKAANLYVSRGRSLTNDAVVRVIASKRLCVASGTRGRVQVDLLEVYRAPKGVVAVAPLRTLSAKRAPATKRLKVSGRRGVKRTDRRLAINVSVTKPTRSGAIRVYGCGRKPPKRATLRFTRGRSTSKLASINPAGKTRLCVTGGRGLRVLVDLQGRRPAR